MQAAAVAEGKDGTFCSSRPAYCSKRERVSFRIQGSPGSRAVGGGVRTGASPPNPKSNRHLTGGGLSTSKMRAESLLVLNHLKIRLMNLPVCIRLIWTLCLEPCDNWNISVAKRYLFKEGSCCTQRGLALFCTPGIRQAKVAFSTATSRQLCLRIYNSFTRRGTSEGNIKFIFPLTRRQNGVINIPGKPVARLTKRF